MSLILCIETATATCSVALIKNGKLISSKQSDKGNTHSAVLNLYIQNLMEEAGLRYSDLDAVAVSKGPGSYTGLRIGVSTAKGFCYALDIPLMAPDTLSCMASGFFSTCNPIPADALLCPMIDARRMEVYTAVFDTNLKPVVDIDAVIVNEAVFESIPETQPVYYFGDGAEKCHEILSSRKNWHLISGFTNAAAHMLNLVTEKYKNSHFEDVAYFEPFYLKDFVAGKPKVKGLR